MYNKKNIQNMNKNFHYVVLRYKLYTYMYVYIITYMNIKNITNVIEILLYLDI